MASQPYILARTIKAAHDFARGPLGLVHGQYRVVNSASTLKAVRNADLYLVPGWQNRFDRFAMQGALRWTRMNVIDTADGFESKAPEDPRGNLTDEVRDLAYAEHAVRSGLGAPGIVTDGLEPPGEQLALVDDDATDFFTEVTNGDVMVSEGGPAFPVEPEVKDPEPEKPVTKRRRRRCKECGTLHFKEESCPEGDS